MIAFSADRRRVDFKAVHAYLSRRSYWAKGRKASLQRVLNANSLCVGLYEGKKQAAFARVVTDYGVFAYLADVFVHEDYRGRGLGKRLMREILRLPKLRKVKQWTLFTKDAQGLYKKYGFENLDDPKRFMAMRRRPR
jgi:ribosomal protein S18 acetylase RimI-like enzyme